MMKKGTIFKREHRPEGYWGKGDEYLPAISEGLLQLLTVINKRMDDLLWLSAEDMEELVCLLTEFGEDIHHEIGLWTIYERYNVQFYATPLPLTVSNEAALKMEPFSAQRIRHFLWNIYSELKPGMVIPAAAERLSFLAQETAVFLEEHFRNVPRDSGIKKFLSEPNDYGWDVKRKLVWMGRHSYFFRVHCRNYLKDNNDGEISIGHIDDFVCQETTRWSGLGVIDILAGVLNISDRDRKDIRGWYERHASYYEVLSIKSEIMELKNIVNDAIYTVMFGDGENPFQVGHCIWGSLVPYQKRWYWSGEQKSFGKISEEQKQEIKQNLIRKTPRIVYRYHQQLAQKAKEMVKQRYEDFVKFFGNDLVVFSDGLTMTAQLQKRDKIKFENAPLSVQVDMLKRYAPQKSFPSFAFPQDLLDDNTGLGVFCNPGEGEEIARDFKNVENGFRKKGSSLNEQEQEAIRIFMEADAASPLFVQRMIREYGDESLADSFFIPDGEDKYYLDYLLRRHKGHFYKNRYPAISFV